MRREKIIFERAFADLEKDLATQKMIVDRSNAAIDVDRKAKELADQQMTTTKREFLKRQEQMRQEMKELEEKAKINAEENIDVQIDGMLSGKNRLAARLDKSNRAKTSSNPSKMKQRLQKTVLSKFQSEEDKKKLKNFGYYSDMWKNIREQTGIEDIDELVMVFLQLEQRKMTRVKEANQLVSQIRALKIAEKEMKEERAAYLKENEDKLAKRKAFVRGLEKDVSKCKEAIIMAENKTQEHLSVIKALSGPVKSLHEKLTSKELTQVLGKFLPTPLLMSGGQSVSVLGDSVSDEVNPMQVLNMMGLIEQRITECVQFYQAHVASVNTNMDDNESNKIKNTFSRGPTLPSGKLKEQYEASLHKIMSITSNRPSRDIDPSEKPLSYEELKAQALAELKGLKT
jgi:hypothetical protein